MDLCHPFEGCGEHFLSHSCFGEPVENRKYNFVPLTERQEVVTSVDVFLLWPGAQMSSADGQILLLA